MLEYVSYPIAPKGLATSFSEAELPDEYCTSFKNRFINAAGGAEKRQGIVRFGATIPGSPEVTGLHEMMLGTESVLFASAEGKIYKYIDDTTWLEVYNSGSSTGVYRSVQMGKKLIFTNGIDRNIYTEDSITFKELKGIIERGDSTSGTDSNSLQDTDVTDWRETNVAVNDLLYNKTQNAYGIITGITKNSVQHTPIDVFGVGVGIGIASAAAQTAGDLYEIIDLVELNVIPTELENDNIAISAADTTTKIVVSGMDNWLGTEIRAGDYIRNTTQGWVTQVTAIASSELYIVRATADAGDSLIFMKPAMPIAVRAHTHFGRLYMIDERDRGKAAISGPNNPEDMTTDAGTFDSTTISFSSYQPNADRLVAFASFQRFIALCGLRNVFLFEGTTPIVDVTTGSVDFNVVGLFPQGVVACDGVISLGNDLVYVNVDGIQSIALRGDASTLGRDNLSEPLRNTLRDEIAAAGDCNTFLFHYPKRSWLCAKISSKMYVYNYTPYFGSGQEENRQFPASRGSWSVFDGPFAQQKVYIVTADGTLYCAGANGRVYKFDQNTYDDDGVIYSTEYRTGWLSMERQNRRGPRIKQGHYIQPVLDAGAQVEYTISVEAPFDSESTDRDVITVIPGQNVVGLSVVGATKIGGTSIVDKKHPLRWRGKEARLTFSTNDAQGPDVLSRFILFITRHGAR